MSAMQTTEPTVMNDEEFCVASDQLICLHMDLMKIPSCAKAADSLARVVYDMEVERGFKYPTFRELFA